MTKKVGKLKVLVGGFRQLFAEIYKTFSPPGTQKDSPVAKHAVSGRNGILLWRKTFKHINVPCNISYEFVILENFLKFRQLSGTAAQFSHPVCKTVHIAQHMHTK